MTTAKETSTNVSKLFSPSESARTFVKLIQSTTVSPTAIVLQEQKKNKTLSVADNNTLGVFQPFMNDTAAHVLTAAYLIVLIFALLGNILVIHTIREKKSLRNAFNMLIVNMALADIMDAIFAIPYSVYSIYYYIDWFPGVFGAILCKILNYGMSVAIGASVLTMAIIAADRYRAIVQALKRPLSFRTGLKCIVAVWVICAVSYSVELYRFDAVPSMEPGKTLCTVRNEPWLHLLAAFDFIVKIAFNYALPLIVMSVVYSVIMYTLWKRQPLGENISAAQRHQRLQARRVVKMVTTILTVFGVCWLPAHTIHLLFAFNPEAVMKMPFWVLHFGFWMAHANSAFNPFIVIIFGKQLREASKHSLRKLISSKKNRKKDCLMKTSETVM